MTASEGAGGIPVAVPAALRVPGIAFRTWRGPEDVAALADVINADSAGAGIEEHLTADEIATELAHASEEDPHRTLVVAEAAGRVVGYARRAWHDRTVFVTYEHVGFVHPDWQRRGLGRALLHIQSDALGRLAADHREAGTVRPEAETRLLSWADERRVGANALLLDEGYAPIRWYIDMGRSTLDDIPTAEPPPGIRIGPADPADEAGLRAALAAEDEAFKDHWGHHAMSAEEIGAVLAEPDLDPGLWRVAWEGEEIAGVLRQIDYADENARFGRRRTWIDHVSVRRPWRGRGVAGALMASAMVAARDRGFTSAGLGVDADNATGALGLYERFGFVRGPVTVAYAKPLPGEDAAP